MNNQLQFLKQSIKNSHISHAYLFFGGLQESKKEVAIEFAQELTGHKQKWTSNPDLRVIEPEGEDKVSIGQMREIKKFLSFEPYLGNNKVIVVNKFDQIKEIAASSILKILEEPPQKSVLILICDNPNALLPTILSRVQKISFAGVNNLPIDKAKKSLYHLKDIIDKGIAERMMEAEKIAKNDGFSVIFDDWITIFLDLAYLTAGNNKLVANQSILNDLNDFLGKKRYSLQKINEILSEMMHWAYIAKTTNVNKRLILENIVIMF